MHMLTAIPIGSSANAGTGMVRHLMAERDTLKASHCVSDCFDWAGILNLLPLTQEVGVLNDLSLRIRNQSGKHALIAIMKAH